MTIIRSGYAVSPYGAGPYGGSHDKTTPSFDIFCFEYGSMYNITSDPIVSTAGSGGHFHPNLATLDMDVYSGAGEPIDDGRIIVTAEVPASFTIEWTVKFDALPTDFTDLIHQHIYAGVSDAAGALVGFLFSKAGVAYTGSVSFPDLGAPDGESMQLDCTMQVLPGSSSYVSEGEYYVVRAAADFDLGIVYFYMTKLSDIPLVGHTLRAILPVIPFTSAATSPTDRSIISVRGTLMDSVVACWSTWCLGTSLIIPNLVPVADAGTDQAVRNCSIILLDGSASFDPEGADLGYYWRLIDGPTTSSFVYEYDDGTTYPLSVPTGFTDKFHSAALGLLDPTDPIDVGTDGDVVLVGGVAYTAVGKGTDGNGFYLQVAEEVIPDTYTSAPFRLVRQRGMKDAYTVHPALYADVPGFYKFDLVVNDGALYSSPSIVLVNVLESVLPRGCAPELSFIFDYLSDFWGLLEDKERIGTFWSSLAQVAATEMFTLWQLEYSKSLRDIQRYFNRRWLHYDLLLPEPLPEITKLHILYGGVRSGWMSSAGEVVNGTTLVVESPLLAAAVTITIESADPVTPEALQVELQAKLRAFVGSGYSLHAIENRTTGDTALRIDAPQPFTVGVGTTCSLFTIGDKNTHPSGFNGAATGYKGYKVGRSLEGVDVQEDDLLILNGEAYRIASVQDNPGDDLPYQRLTLKEQLPEDASTEWAIGSWATSEFLDFYSGLVTSGDYIDFEVSEITTTTATERELVGCTALGVNEMLPGKVAIDAWEVAPYAAQFDLYTTYIARVLRRSYVPIDTLVSDIPTLQRLIIIEDDEETLRRNVDYFIEDMRGQHAVRFVSGMGLDPDVWEGDRPPNRLWAEYTYLDNRPLIEANFGYVIGLGLDQLADIPGNIDYLSAVRGLWHSFYNGPTLENLRIGAQILLGLPFAEEDSYIEEIRTDFSPKYGRILLRDKANPQIIRSYSFPNVLLMERSPETGERYVVGDFVRQFSPLVEGVEILDYVKDPLWYGGYLNQGIFYEPEKYHRFAVTVDIAAFNLNTLTLVRNFVLQAKPIYTYPMFVVRYEVGETEVSVTDQQSTTVWVNVQDAARSDLIGSSFILDEPRCAFGGIRNRLDCDQDPSSTPPTSPVTWGLDKNYFLIPDESLIIISSETFAAPFTPTLDSVFILDQNIGIAFRYEDTSPASIPAGPTGYALTPVGGVTLPYNGDLCSIRFIAMGDPGTDDTDYELVVSIAGVDTVVEPFTAGVNTEVVVATPTGSGLLGDAIGVRVRPATGGARTPNWSRLLAYVRVEDSAWTLDDTLPAGSYSAEHTA